MPRIPLFNQGAQPASRAARIRTPMAPTTPVRVAMGTIDKETIANFSSEPEADPRPWLREGAATARFGEAIQEAGQVLNKLALAKAETINRLDLAEGEAALDRTYADFEQWKQQTNADPREWGAEWERRSADLEKRAITDRMSPVVKDRMTEAITRFRARSAILVETDATKKLFQLDGERIRATAINAADRGDLPGGYAALNEGVALGVIGQDEAAAESIRLRERVKAKTEEEELDNIWTSAEVDPRYTFDHFRAGGFERIKDPRLRVDIERQLARRIEEKKQTFLMDQLKAVELGERPPFAAAEIRTWLRDGSIPDTAALNMLESQAKPDDPAMLNHLMRAAASFTPGVPGSEHEKAAILNGLAGVSPGYRTVVREMLDKAEKGETSPQEALVFQRISAGVSEGRWGKTKRKVDNFSDRWDVVPEWKDEAEKKALAAQMHMNKWFADKKAKGGYKPGEEWAELNRLTGGAALSGFGGLMERTRFGAPAAPEKEPEQAPPKVKFDVEVPANTKVTHFAFPGDAYKDSNSQARIGAWTSAEDAANAKAGDFTGATLLQDGDFALSRDMEASARAAGVKPGEPVLVSVNGQWVHGRWWDRTSDKLSGRVDFYSPTGEHPLNGKPVDGFLKIKPLPPEKLKGDDWDKIRLDFLELNQSLPEASKRAALQWLAQTWARVRVPTGLPEAPGASSKINGALFDE